MIKSESEMNRIFTKTTQSVWAKNKKQRLIFRERVLNMWIKNFLKVRCFDYN